MRRTYGRILYLLLALPLGMVWFTVLVTAISFGFGTAITLIGIPILIGTVWAWRWMAEVERGLIGRLVRHRDPEPVQARPGGGALVASGRRPPVGPGHLEGPRLPAAPAPGSGSSPSRSPSPCSASGSARCSPPRTTGHCRTARWDGPLSIDSLGAALAVVPLGALVLLLGIPGLGALGRLYGWMASQLLGSNADPVLTAQVSQLQDARSRIIAAADAERRRIERDLHDGAQQRLVALALNLRMAEGPAAAGDPAAAELVRKAGEEAQLALKELRDLARGIHPAILTNRGLPAAVEDLASRATVPVEVVATPSERLPDAVEAAAYFVVSECLANIGKHAQASSATVSVSAVGRHLEVVVADDGIGGGDLESGSGVQGLVDRVGALNGSLTMESPPGAGTRVTAAIPLDQSDAGDAPALPAGTPRILPDAGGRARAGRAHAPPPSARLSLGIVAAVLVAIWALTGPELPWIAWPLLGIGFVAAMDAWRVLATPPVRESELVGGDDRAAALSRLLEAPRPAQQRGHPRHPEPVPDRNLDRVRERLLLARLGDAGLSAGDRPEGAATPWRAIGALACRWTSAPLGGTMSR